MYQRHRDRVGYIQRDDLIHAVVWHGLEGFRVLCDSQGVTAGFFRTAPDTVTCLICLSKE